MSAIEKLLRDVGISKADSAQFLQKLQARGARDAEVERKFRHALDRAGIEKYHHDRVIQAVDDAGLFPDGDQVHAAASTETVVIGQIHGASTKTAVIEQIQAALNDPRRAPAMKTALGEMRRCKVTAADFENLDRALEGVNLDYRFRLKAALRAAGIGSRALHS